MTTRPTVSGSQRASAERTAGGTRPAVDAGARFAIDITAEVEAIRAGLRDEILAELRAEGADSAWPEWLNVESAARYLDVSPERVRKLIGRRAMPFYQEAPGCRVHLRRRDLDDWMQTFRTEPAARIAATNERSTTA